MITVTLNREYRSKETIGTFYCAEQGWTRYSVELPWKNNMIGLSCIPAGEYECVEHVSPKFGRCYWLPKVKGRTQILIHPANYVYQLRGCIATGTSHADIDGDGVIDVVNSRKALEFMLEKLGKKFILIIQPNP